MTYFEMMAELTRRQRDEILRHKEAMDNITESIENITNEKGMEEILASAIGE